MKKFKYIVVLFAAIVWLAACKEEKASENTPRIVKGLYVFGPDLRSFTDCQSGGEYWVADSSKTLEMAYSGLNFEKPYEPVYVELEGVVVASDTTKSADFDSTLVVKKMVKISKTIPDGPCAK